MTAEFLVVIVIQFYKSAGKESGENRGAGEGNWKGFLYYNIIYFEFDNPRLYTWLEFEII